MAVGNGCRLQVTPRSVQPDIFPMSPTPDSGTNQENIKQQPNKNEKD